MERETGIEPATSSLGSWRSTAELLPLGLSSLAQSLPPRKPGRQSAGHGFSRADPGTNKKGLQPLEFPSAAKAVLWAPRSGTLESVP